MLLECSEELINNICEKTATSQLSLNSICKSLSVPYSTLLNWLYDDDYKDKEGISILRKKYARAKEDQIQYLADEILRLTYEMEVKIRENKTYNGENINAAVANLRIQIDSLKWILSKLKPKTFGDRIEIENTGNPIAILKAEIIQSKPDELGTT